MAIIALLAPPRGRLAILAVRLVAARAGKTVRGASLSDMLAPPPLQQGD
jgi:hypothetical protein